MIDRPKGAGSPASKRSIGGISATNSGVRVELSTPAVTTLKIADIVANSGVRSSHLDAQQVEMYRRSIYRFLPVVVFETEEGLLLADRYHRLAAAVAEGQETIEAEVRHGSRHDALADAVTVGAAHDRGIG